MTEQEYEDTLKRRQGPPETKEDKKLRKKCAETHTEEHSLSNQASDRATKGLSISSVKKLRDRLIPQHQYEWYYDPRMPQE